MHRSQITTPYFLYFIAAAILGLSACGSDSGGSNATNPQPSSTSIGPEGGTARSVDGRLTLTIPQGALGNSETITITSISADDLGPEFDGVDVASAYELGPDGLQFMSPITVELLTGQNPVFDADSLLLNTGFLLTSDIGQAVALANPTVAGDQAASTVTVAGELEHFSPLVHSERAYTVRVDGMPDSVIVEGQRTFPIQVSAIAELIQIERARFEDFSSTPLISSLGSDSALLVEQDNNNLFQTELDYQCNEAEANVRFFSEFLIEPSANQDPELIIPPPMILALTKQVDCVNPDGGPPPEPVALQVGVFAAPGNTTDPETIQLLALGAGFGNFQDAQQLLAVLVGAEGITIFDAITREVSQQFNDGPQLGAVGAHQPANDNEPSPSALFSYSGNGGFLRNNTFEGGSFGSGGNIFRGSIIDAFPTGGVAQSDEILICDSDGGGPDAPGGIVIAYDAGFDTYERGTPFATGARPCISLYGASVGGPVLSASRTIGSFDKSLLYYSDRNGEATEIGELGADARRIRCNDTPTVCAVTLFGDDAIRVVSWDGVNAPSIVGDPISVGDGPVDPGLFELPTGNTRIVSPGFNDNTITLTEVDAGGNLISNTIYAAPNGVVAPAHVTFVPNPDQPDNPFIVGTGFNSDNYFVADEDYLMPVDR